MQYNQDRIYTDYKSAIFQSKTDTWEQVLQKVIRLWTKLTLQVGKICFNSAQIYLTKKKIIYYTGGPARLTRGKT